MESGSSLAVENVQELAFDNRKDVPARYIRPEIELEEILADESSGIPVIDMSKLAGFEHVDFHNEMKKLHQACQEWGFFQLINHGSEEKIKKMKMVTTEFFKQPLEEKTTCAMSSNCLEGYGQHFVVSNDQKLDWCDLLFLRVLPIDIRNMTVWPNTPRTFRCAMEEYSHEMNKTFFSLLKLMVINLGANSDALNPLCQDNTQYIRMNYYPPCMQANKVIGLTPHSDASMLTLLVQANEVEGLQVRKDNNWVPVKPFQDAIVVNIGDVMEMISNGIYKSIEHRAMVNFEKERLSIAAFHGPNITSEIAPLAELISHGVNYKTVEFKDLLTMYFECKLDGKSLLSRVKMDDIETSQSQLVIL